MIKNERNNQNFFQENNSDRKIKNKYIKSNSPIVSKQENNYFYNTKINHLILQGLSNTNREASGYQPQQQLYNSVYINYDISNKAGKKESNILQKKINSSLNKDNKNIIGLDNFITSRKLINSYSRSFIQENANNNNNNYKSNLNNYYSNNNKNNKNNYNPFEVLNYLKKRKNINNNIFDIGNNDTKFNKNNQIYENNISTSNLSKSGIMKNKSNSTYIEGISQRNNSNKYFYNIQINKNKSNKDVSVNNIGVCRKIPLKNEKIGNYQIKSPGVINPKKNINKYGKNNNNKINVEKKNGCKSPEIIGKNKTKYISLKNPKNAIYKNNSSNIYNSDSGFYKKENDLKAKSRINVGNLQKKNINNNNEQKTNTINNINRYNNYNEENIINKNLVNDKDNKVNTQNDIYIKINPKNYRIGESIIKSNNGLESPKITNYMDKKTNNNSHKHNIKNKILNLNQINKNLEEFCDILEQFYYNSFKNCYSFFIQKITSFTEQKNLNRAIVLRRLKDGRKSKNSNNIMHSDSIKNAVSNNNKYSGNKEINDPRKIEKSPTKFVELQKNIMPSMMKINQDNYIEMFNELFKRQNESYEDKKCRSPVIQKRKLGDNYILKDSLDLGSSDINEKKYDKYKTNTNVSGILYFPKKTNLKLKIDLNNHSNNNKKIYNIAFQKSNIRPSLSTDNKKLSIYNNSNIKSRKYIKSNQLDSKLNTEYNINNAIIKKNEMNIGIEKDDPIENTEYYDTKIFQNQKYKISNSPEPYFYNNRKDNSDKRIYNKKIEQSQVGKNLILYTKPLLKKSITKETDNLNKSNNMHNINIISVKKNERNKIDDFKNNMNTSYSYSLINMHKNDSLKASFNYNNQKSIFDNLNYKDELKNIFNKNNKIYEEIIIKNVCTKDNRLHVFIKYIELGYIPVKNKNMYKKLYCNHTDSITLINPSLMFNNKRYPFINNNENDFDNANLENSRLNNLRTTRNINYCENEELNEKKNIMNSYSSAEEINNNSITYLFDVLQNMYNDNKKLMLFNFFKNLRKIKTTAILHSSIKTREKNKSKYLNLNNAKKNHHRNIIEINNFNNYKNLNSNKSEDMKIKINKSVNMKNNLSNSLNPRVTRNREIERSQNVNKPKLDDNIFISNNKINDKINNNKNKRHYYNTSFNKINKMNNNSNKNSENSNIKKDSLMLETNDSKEEEMKPVKMIEISKNTESNEEKIKEKIKEENNKVEEKEKLKKIKLAKLGKIFKNLEQENNIINAIKEQFLEWSNNNNLDLRRSENKRIGEIDQKQNKRYGIKTFDMKFMFNNSLNYDENKDIIGNKKEYQEIINNFKNKLIIFALKKKNDIQFPKKEENDIKDESFKEEINNDVNEEIQSINKNESNEEELSKEEDEEKK